MTLLEIMIALVVLSIALLGVLSMMLVTQNHNQSSSERTLASKACQEVMEQVIATPYNNLMATWNNAKFGSNILTPPTPVNGNKPILYGLVTVTQMNAETLAPDAGGTMMQITVTFDTTTGPKSTRLSVKQTLVAWKVSR
jgi:type II secretory pathway pseudopilin PulG